SPVSHKKILVSEANPGLCADLENAALHYANGQAAQAREVLELGIVSDDDTRNSPLAWLALFDLLQRANDRAAFDQLALRYVVAFERSAPAWEDRGGSVAPGRATGSCCWNCFSGNTNMRCSKIAQSNSRSPLKYRLHPGNRRRMLRLLSRRPRSPLRAAPRRKMRINFLGTEHLPARRTR